MLQIKKVNASEMLTNSTTLEIICTSRDLSILKAALYLAVSDLERERNVNLTEEFRRLRLDILNFEFQDYEV